MTIDPLPPLVMNQLDCLITKAECDRVIKVEIPTDVVRWLVEIAKRPANDALRDEIANLNGQLCDLQMRVAAERASK